MAPVGGGGIPSPTSTAFLGHHRQRQRRAGRGRHVMVAARVLLILLEDQREAGEAGAWKAAGQGQDVGAVRLRGLIALCLGGWIGR